MRLSAVHATASVLRCTFVPARQVDDGTQKEPGKEIEFVASFVRAAISTESTRALDKQMRQLRIGWEGAISAADVGPGMSEDAADGSDNGEDAGLAICMCFEGGGGTLRNVWSAVLKGTPALVVQGTGRVSDLIADCLLFYGHGAAGDPDGLEYDGVPQIFTEDGERRSARLRLITEFEALMSQPEVEQLCREFREIGKDSEKDFTVRTDLVDLGKRLFAEYKCPFQEKAQGCNVLDLMDQLHYTVTSGLCLAYRLGSQRALGPKDGTATRATGDSVPVGVHEFISRCMLRAIAWAENRADFEAKTAAASAARRERQSVVVMPLATGSGEAPGGGETGAAPFHEKLCEKKMRLLTNWGQVDLMKIELSKERNVPPTLLSTLLQLALVNDQPEVAAFALDRGADLGVYNPKVVAGGNKKAPAVAGDKQAPAEDVGRVWLELMRGASDEPEERYLRNLIFQAYDRIVRRGQAERVKDDEAVVSDPGALGCDLRAVGVLNEVYAMVAKASGEGYGPNVDDGFYFALEQNGEWAGSDFNLFMFMTLVNRTGLADIFFLRDAESNTVCVNLCRIYFF